MPLVGSKLTDGPYLRPVLTCYDLTVNAAGIWISPAQSVRGLKASGRIHDFHRLTATTSLLMLGRLSATASVLSSCARVKDVWGFHYFMLAVVW